MDIQGALPKVEQFLWAARDYAGQVVTGLPGWQPVADKVKIVWDSLPKPVKGVAEWATWAFEMTPQEKTAADIRKLSSLKSGGLASLALFETADSVSETATDASGLIVGNYKNKLESITLQEAPRWEREDWKKCGVRVAALAVGYLALWVAYRPISWMRS